MPAAQKRATAKTTSVSGADHRRRRGEQEHEEIEVTLAHYLPADNPFTGEEQQAGDSVTLKRHEARHLISAGYAAVDAEDQEAVAAALRLGPGDEGKQDPPEQP